MVEFQVPMYDCRINKMEGGNTKGVEENIFK